MEFKKWFENIFQYENPDDLFDYIDDPTYSDTILNQYISQTA